MAIERAAGKRTDRELVIIELAAVELPANGRDPEQIRRVVEDVLSRPEFADAQPSLFQRVLGWLGQQLARFLSLVGESGLGQVAFALVLGLSLAAIVVGLVLFARRVRRSGTAPGAATVGSGGRSGQEWRTLASDAEGDGDHRVAVRCRYRALVADFAEAGWVEEIPGRTSGQYRRAVEQDVPTAGAAFARATEVFERAWYGSTETTAEDTRVIKQAASEAYSNARGRAKVDS